MEFNELVEELQGIGRIGHTSNHQHALVRLNELATSSEIRDFNWEISFEVNLYKALFHVLMELWNNKFSDKISTEESTALSLWIKVHGCPDYDNSLAAKQASSAILTSALDRVVELSCLPVEPAQRGLLSNLDCIRILQHLIISLYDHRVDLRSSFRTQLTKRLLHTCRGGKVAAQDGGNERVHVSYLLSILHPILRGLGGSQDLKHDVLHEHGGLRDHGSAATRLKMEIFFKVLLPLHQPNEMVAWRDQVPIIQSYHEELVRCTVCIVDTVKAPAERHRVLVEIVTKVLGIWPEKHSTNTPKQVLLLHEIEVLVERCDVEDFKAVEAAFMRRFLACIGNESENIRPAQRALQFFKNSKLVALFCQYQTQTGSNIVTQIIEALYRGGRLSWNPTVNKMTALALKQIKKVDEALFVAACDAILRTLCEEQPALHHSTSKTELIGSRPSSAAKHSDDTMMAPVAKPPIPAAHRPRPRSQEGQLGELRNYSKENPPPVTVTGVAPWAMNSSKAVPVHSLEQNPHRAGYSAHAPSMPPPSSAITHTVQDHKRMREAHGEGSSIALGRKQPVDMMAAYMVHCFAGIFDNSADPSRPENKSWNLHQASASPVFLPELRFHDIVYGKVLGEGAFSTVKYARQIVRDESQSSWPEFAVKTISSEKLLENNYAPLALREIGTLRLLEHPNISRLISYFRYKDSIYLVLEFAAKGDLHSHLVESGKLPHELLRFVGGEIVAALAYLHDLGFAFNDLKPENILVTELGHIKLADFGAARALNADSRRLLFSSIDDLMQLRNGDWKEDEKISLQDTSVGAALREGSLLAKAQGDERYEGTPAYMPPELFSENSGWGEKSFVGSEASVLSDSWALGCVLYFALHGKPRFYGDIDQVREQWRVFMAEHQHSRVHFDAASSHHEPRAADFYESAACETLIEELLATDPRSRPSVISVLQHPYLTQGFLPEHSQHMQLAHNIPHYDPVALYNAAPPSWPTCSSNEGGGAEDIWKRRQFSSLWAPMPKDYNLHGHDLPSVKGYGGGEDPLALSLLSQPLPVVMDDLDQDPLHNS